MADIGASAPTTHDRTDGAPAVAAPAPAPAFEIPAEKSSREKAKRLLIAAPCLITLQAKGSGKGTTKSTELFLGSSAVVDNKDGQIVQGHFVDRTASGAIARLADHQLRRDEQNDKMFGQLTEIVTGFRSEIVSLGHSLLDLKKGAKEGEERLHNRVDGVQKEIKELRAEANASEFKHGLRRHYLPYLPLGFDGRTGNNLWCPVAITDHNGIDREIVVLSLPCLSRFYAEECPSHIDAQTTMSFFMGPAMKRALGLNYKDIINALLLTGFSFLAVGKKWNQMRTRNTARFVIVEADWFKQLLADIDTHFPDRPPVRDFVNGGKAPNYKADGVDYGFWEVSKTDMSTGHIVQIAQTIPLLRKRTMPVIGETWVREWYTKMIAKFFGIPDHLVGVHHVVGSVLEIGSGPVPLHRDALKDYKRRKNHQKYKRAKISKEF